MSTDVRSKIIQSDGSFGFWLANLIKKNTKNCCYVLPRDSFPGLVSNLASNAINKFERKISGKGAMRAGKGFNLFILIEENEMKMKMKDMNEII